MPLLPNKDILEDTSVLIVAGPTASGKSSLAVELAQEYNGEIVNCDMAQCYKPFPIGTAQPSHEEKKDIAHYLFGYIDSPREHSAYAQRTLIEDKCKNILENKKLPIIVGGSSYYIYSLFFSLREGSKIDVPFVHDCSSVSSQCLTCINKVDPATAQRLHPSDLYRIERALEIIGQGYIPSSRSAFYNPSFSYKVIEVLREKEDLHKRIISRTEVMLKSGWIEETKELREEWRLFVKKKNFIGYPLIMEFIEGRLTSFNDLQNAISLETKQYAKRQLTFLKRIDSHLSKYHVHQVKWREK